MVWLKAGGMAEKEADCRRERRPKVGRRVGRSRSREQRERDGQTAGRDGQTQMGEEAGVTMFREEKQLVEDRQEEPKQTDSRESESPGGGPEQALGNSGRTDRLRARAGKKA